MNIPRPSLQIDFSFALGQIRSVYLQDALLSTVKEIDLLQLDKELATHVPQSKLKELASHGLRGELVFPVPCLLRANPFLLGYYRLLLGFSQKEFYSKHFGTAPFKPMEEKGVISASNDEKLEILCRSLINSAAELIEGVGFDRISKDLLDDLTLLTVGPQLRGGANVKKGIAATVAVFETIYAIVKYAATESTPSKIQIVNAAGRRVSIEFAPDPDIVIREEMSAESIRNIIAIEVKGGKDFSNVHNRIGEAEKSHQKAKAFGFVECWTVLNVEGADLELAKKESPSTNRFYLISDLTKSTGGEYEDFKNRIIALTGIKASKTKRKPSKR
jgi:hypothetical protein